MKKMEVDLLAYEKELYQQGYKLICGTDEAGRGPLVGPVVAAAVILPKNYHLDGLNDSKQLSEKKREALFPVIKQEAIAYGIGIVDAKVIDEVNIYEASRMAMQEAIQNMQISPDYVLTDAMPFKEYPIPVFDPSYLQHLQAGVSAGASSNSFNSSSRRSREMEKPCISMEVIYSPTKGAYTLIPLSASTSATWS